MDNNPPVETPFEFFARRLVAFVGTYVLADDVARPSRSSPAPRHHYVYSGVPVALFGNWYVVTAGHSILPYCKAIDEKSIIATGGSIVDSFGVLASKSKGFPFNLRDHCLYSIDEPDDGLDYALIKLSQNHVDLLSTNSVMAFRMGTESDETREYSNYVAFGLPDEKSDLVSSDPGNLNYVNLQPWSVPISRLDDDDCTNPRFVGRIKALSGIDSIVGISGGPIIAFSEDNEYYRLAAIQSRWHASTQTIFATQVEASAKHFKESCEQFADPEG